VKERNLHEVRPRWQELMRQWRGEQPAQRQAA
jgi:hypothetical protein